MKKPYQKDIANLKKELKYHAYMARKFAQEYNISYTRDFQSMCKEIRKSITIMKQRQMKAVTEWAQLTLAERQAILRPLVEATELAARRARKRNCPEFASYLDNFLTNYLIDLMDARFDTDKQADK